LTKGKTTAVFDNLVKLSNLILKTLDDLPSLLFLLFGSLDKLPALLNFFPKNGDGVGIFLGELDSSLDLGGVLNDGII